MSRRRATKLYFGATLMVGAAVGACVTEHVTPLATVGSFKVEIVSEDPFARPTGCGTAPEAGSATCPRAFPDLATPFRARVRATALDRGASGRDVQPLAAFAGTVMIDVRPGRLVNAGPGGLGMTFASGVAEADVEVAYASGETHVWVEDCGVGGARASFATGVSPPLFFDLPRLDQIQTTTDNTVSPMVSSTSNLCAVSGDPRYALGVDAAGVVGYQGFSQGGAVNAPPAPSGAVLTVMGCSRADFDRQSATGGCARGPLVVTAVGKGGLFVSDLSPASVARGFNSIEAATFGYPKGVQVGDVLLSLRGSPVELDGTTALASPVWRRDGVGLGQNLLPTPTKVAAAVYQSALAVHGANRPESLDLEKLESGLVCFDTLAPASVPRLCDVTETGAISTDPGCVSACYDDPACLEAGSYRVLGLWVADVYGRYALGSGDAAAVKLAVLSRDTDPELDPLAFGDAQRQKPAAERQTLRVVGSLTQALSARPVWLVTPRSPSDITVDAKCP